METSAQGWTRLADPVESLSAQRRRSVAAEEDVVDLGSPVDQLSAIVSRRGYAVRSLAVISVGGDPEAPDTSVFRLILRNGQMAAVKVIDRSRLPALQRDEGLPREMELISRLRHAHVVRTLHVFATRSLNFVIMELAEGGSLRQLLDRKGKLPVAERGSSGRVLLRQVLEGVVFLHGVGVAHRDLKDDNILIDARGNARIADLGFALKVTGHECRWCGTDEYNSPEVTLHEPYDPRAADVFSLGTTCFLVSYGIYPFAAQGESRVTRVCNQLLGRIDFPPSADRDAVTMFCGALKAEPETRWTVLRLQSAVFFPTHRLFAVPPDFMSP